MADNSRDRRYPGVINRNYFSIAFSILLADTSSSKKTKRCSLVFYLNRVLKKSTSLALYRYLKGPSILTF